MNRDRGAGPPGRLALLAGLVAPLALLLALPPSVWHASHHDDHGDAGDCAVCHSAHQTADTARPAEVAEPAAPERIEPARDVRRTTPLRSLRRPARAPPA